MKLSEFPEEINKFSLELQKEIEARDEFLNHKKAADITIEKIVQGLDKKVCSNDPQREIARFDLRDDYYESILGAISEAESSIAQLKIHIQFLRDSFTVAKLESQERTIV
jgi:hypothetical protein